MFYLFDYYFFFERERDRVKLGGQGGDKDLGRVGGGKNMINYCMKNILKKKKKNQLSGLTCSSTHVFFPSKDNP